MKVQPTVDFTWEAFLNEDICVDFKTKEDSNSFFLECIKRGMAWQSGIKIEIPVFHTKIVCYRYKNRIGCYCFRLPVAYYYNKPNTVVDLI